jgi:DHA1 family bicyclomycin/chloramphenicol resistance-like MFS transporter
MRIPPASFFTVWQPPPQMAGALGAAAGSVQMTSGAISSALVAVLCHGSSMLSTTTVMTLGAVAVLVSYLLTGRHARCRVAGFNRDQLGQSVTPVE